MSVMCIFDLNLDISDLINQEVIKLKKLKIIKEKQKIKHDRLINHINAGNDCLNKYIDILEGGNNNAFFIEDICYEYLLELEELQYEAMQEQRMYNYYDSSEDSDYDL